MPATVTSTSLLQGLRDPENAQAWDAFVGRYRPLLVRFGTSAGLSREDAEDVAQVSLFEFAKAYRDGRYERDRARLRSWLFGIARNQLRRFRDRAPRREFQADGASTTLSAPEPAVTDDAIEALWDQEWRGAVLRQCVDEVRRELSPATVRAFELFTLEGRPAEAVAAEVGITANAVYLAKRRVLTRIRDLVPLMEEIW